MLIHPWDAAVDATEWRDWLATTGRFGVLAVNNVDPAQAPLLLPTHFTLAGEELLIHLARPNPVWPHLEAATEVRLAVIGDYAYIPTYWRAKAGGRDEDGVPTSYYSSVQFVCCPTIVDDPHAKVEILDAQLADFQPEGRHAEVAVGEHPYGRMLPGIRGVRLAVVRVEAKFKYDDANPVEHRQRVIGYLEERDRGLDTGAAAQQRRRVAAIGDWRTRLDKPTSMGMDGSMQRFPLADYNVHRVGFGAMQLPGPGVFGPPRDREQALAVLRRAVEAGVDHIDTSQFYGPDVANELIREALHPYPDSLALVSKVGARRDNQGGWLPDNEPHRLRAGIEENLRTLGVDRLAVVNLRVMESEPDALFTDQLGTMMTARDEGLIAGIGLSNVSHEQLLHALAITDIVCVQNPFNLVDRASQPVLDECIARDIAFVPFFPLGSAFHDVNPVLTHHLIEGAAKRLGYTPAQIALAWTLGVAENVLLIPGTSSLGHLEENLAVADIELDEETQRELTAVA